MYALAVRDMAGNPNVGQTNLPIRESPDVVPPQVLRAVLHLSNGTLVVTVREVFIIHVDGGPRCVTSSTDHIRKRRARITLTVECIRTCLFCIFYLMCQYKYEYEQD